MQQPMQMLPQQAFMMCLPQPQAQAAPADEKKNDDVPGFRKGMEQPVTTASIPFSKMPKCRLTEAIEFVDPKLDVTLTASFEPSVLCMISWEQTNIKPVMKINDLRCGSYLEVYQRLRCASKRLKTIPAKAQVYKEYVDRMKEGQNDICHIATDELLKHRRPHRCCPEPKPRARA